MAGPYHFDSRHGIHFCAFLCICIAYSLHTLLSAKERKEEDKNYLTATLLDIEAGVDEGQKWR